MAAIAAAGGGAVAAAIGLAWRGESVSTGERRDNVWVAGPIIGLTMIADGPKLHGKASMAYQY